MRIIFLLSLLFSLHIQANECTEYFHNGGSYSYHRQESGDSCYLSVHPMQTQDLTYRDFLFSNKGVFMVFNSYGEGSNSETTGARVYYLFPRNQMPDIEVKENSIVVTSAHSKSLFEFSKTSLDIIHFSSGTIRQDPKVHPENKGGLELGIQTGLLLDSGFAIGRDPTENPNSYSSFSDGKNSCRLKNKELFQYFEDGNVEFRFTDDELKKYLSKTCPKIKVTF